MSRSIEISDTLNLKRYATTTLDPTSVAEEVVNRLLLLFCDDRVLDRTDSLYLDGYRVTDFQ